MPGRDIPYPLISETEGPTDVTPGPKDLLSVTFGIKTRYDLPPERDVAWRERAYEVLSTASTASSSR